MTSDTSVTSPGERVVVLDDDPTGTQTVADLPIVLTPDRPTLSAASAAYPGPLWVLTNTRAMSEAAATAFLATVAANVRAVLGPSVRLVLRGDSTLRGHVLPEIDTLAAPDAVALFVPAFLEQGRVTVHGVHYAEVGGRRVEVAATEYARDPEFGYTSSRLTDWVHEREPGRPALGMPLETLRGLGSAALTDLLLSAPARAVVVPDAETADDLGLIGDAWAQAQLRGRNVVLRCAASLASVVAQAPPRPVTLKPVTGPVLVVCASYSSGATAQLAELADLADVATFKIDLAQGVGPGVAAARYRAQLATTASDSLRAGRVTVLSTPREPRPAYLSLAAGEKVMDAVVEIVKTVSPCCAALVTKGGITSARIARDALAAKVAYVRGQVLPGIPVWTLHANPVGSLDQVVVPGNVGEPDAIRTVVGALTGRRQ